MENKEHLLKKYTKYAVTAVIVILTGTLVVLGVLSSPYFKHIRESQIQERKRAEKEYIQYEADRVVNNIRYIQDPQTGICYAYYFDINSRIASNSLTVVPCEKIPPELLTRGNMRKK
ncbi:MAG: hypothetical protein RIQ54_136 [Candidatus Parcubacteria bacterium]|jgi:hypothetical protein